MVLLEVCANSIASCIAAEKGGAGRIELCAALGEGGVTPSPGMVMGALDAVSIPVFPIIRPRGGDFLYSDLEVQQMLTDIRYYRDLGVQGFVVGALSADGRLDQEICRALIQSADGLPVTLHRAFDMSLDLSSSLEVAIDLGFSRILTSGGKQTAEDGISVLKRLVHQAENRIEVMAGSGVCVENARRIAIETGVRELHGSFQSMSPSGMKYHNPSISMGGSDVADEYQYPMTDVEKVRAVVGQL